MGAIAALLTAACWGLSSIFFTSASRKAGPLPVNRVRLLFAVPMLAVAHLLLTGYLFPLHAGSYRWLWLGVSGITGLVLGDTLLFKAYALIGNRLGTLLMSSVPVISSLIAFFVLDEKLGFSSVLGIIICVSGIALVVMERRTENGVGSVHEKRQYFIGVVCGLGGALGQSIGLVLAKQGLQGDFPSISGALIRMLTATVFIWAITIISGQTRPTLQKVFSSSKTARDIFFGSLAGPFIGVWLSQIAIQYTYVGIASTLMALTPVFLLPVAKYVNKEDVSRRAVVGTVIAIAGVAIIFL
jgi:drug/metabolite transporter (DMT)-like permease